MFEDDELQLNNIMNNKCEFCNKVIKQLPASSTDGKLKFCDIICAKLYYDNFGKFTFDIKKYNTYYNEGQLDKKAKEIFERCRFLMFEQLPIYKPLDDDPIIDDPKMMKKIYNKILSPILFKSIGAYE